MKVTALGATSDIEEKSQQRTIGKYRVIDTVGFGGMGVVYRARDPEIGRDVAIKTLRPTIAGSPDELAETMRRFRLEARSAGNLRHPNIITIFDANYDHDTPYIVMEFVAGDSLAAILKRNVRIPSTLAITYLLQLAAGIDYAHERGVVHRDLKPNNILVDPQDHVFILDFGIAGAHRRIVGSDNTPASSGVVGTPAYMSPEQVRGAETGRASDLFSFGAMAFEMLTGKLPFRGETATAIMQSILNGNRTQLAHVAPDLPPNLEQVFARALAADPAQRFPTAHEMVSIMDQMFVRARSTNQSSAVQLEAIRRAEARDNSKLEEARAYQAKAKGGQDNRAGSTTTEMDIGGAAGVKGDPTTKPGYLFREPATIILPRSDKQKRVKNGKRANGVVAAAVFAAAVMVPLIFSLVRGALQDSESENVPPSSAPQTAHLVAADLVPPSVAPIPVGKLVSEMNDRQLLGVIMDDTRPEGEIIEAIEIAMDRRIPDLVNASVVPLSSSSSRVRLAMVNALGKFGDRKIVIKLAERIEDPEAAVRIAATIALAKLGDRRVVEYLKLRYSEEPIVEVKSQLKKAIEQISGLPLASS